MSLNTTRWHFIPTPYDGYRAEEALQKSNELEEPYIAIQPALGFPFADVHSLRQQVSQLVTILDKTQLELRRTRLELDNVHREREMQLALEESAHSQLNGLIEKVEAYLIIQDQAFLHELQSNTVEILKVEVEQYRSRLVARDREIEVLKGQLSGLKEKEGKSLDVY